MTALLRSLSVELTASLIVSSLLAAFPLFVVVWRRIGVEIALAAWGLLSLGLLVAGGVVLYRHRDGKLGQVVGRVGIASAWALAGAAIAGLLLGAGYGVNALARSGGPCSYPLELRVLTTPDALTAVRYAAADFVVGTRSHGCPAYSVTVTSESGATPVRNGLARGWEGDQTSVGAQLLGPQPDVWIPSSPAEYAYGADPANLATSDSPPKVTADPSSLGRSPMVLGLFGDDNGRVYSESSLPGRDSTTELLTKFKAAGIKGIARPIPESSAVALAVTPVLHRSITNAGMAPDGAAAERLLSPADPPELLAPDAVSLLCQLRATAQQGGNAPGSRPPFGYAVVVSEQLLNDYNAGRPLGDSCGGVNSGADPYDQWKLYPYYANDLPSLDYRFVQLKWPGQDDAARANAVNSFKNWLTRHPLTSQGFRGRDGSYRRSHTADSAHPYLSGIDRLGNSAIPSVIKGPEAPGVQDALDAISAVRKKVLISIVLDTSGSMGAPASTPLRGSRLTHAVSLLRSLVDQLKGDDVAGLQTFARPRQPADRPVMSVARAALISPTQSKLLNDKLQAQSVARPDVSLTDAVTGADLSYGERDAIVVTDGQSLQTNPSIGKDRARLADYHHKHPNLRLTLLLTGPTGCDVSPAKDVRQAMGGRCVLLNDDPDEAQAARLLSTLR
ncbi:VWA domain-containing protein [Actinomadura barringtoniae]|uniref:VWA domain-containing protein n=1 Tax=Actinomadura barringtoniae TaxID=1427535 RepID=A0A939T6P6_9ACTN|nr:VWA domain-containing protein [Actinomadura barringtoniae]MBO2451089.1 VWA domain-containing protein [Actinomadura barringtoniae]